MFFKSTHFRKNKFDEKDLSVKPYVYSVIKAGFISLTKYIATSWVDQELLTHMFFPLVFLIIKMMDIIR